jgi:hypothetical protein
MVRDITTTYNVNIDEKEYRKIADSAWAKSRPESTEITAPKAQMGLSKIYYPL